MTPTDKGRTVAAALLGYDYRTILVGDQSYIIHPPTIRRLAGAAYWLASLAHAETLHDMLAQWSNLHDMCRALSWLVTGDESLADTFAEAKPEEVLGALEEGLSLIDTANFPKLSVLARSVVRLTANQR